MDISITPLDQQIVSITDFRRHAGSYLDQLIPLTIVRGSQIVGHFIPAKKSSSLDEVLKKIETLSGGFELGNYTPEKLNKIFESSYE